MLTLPSECLSFCKRKSRIECFTRESRIPDNDNDNEGRITRNSWSEADHCLEKPACQKIAWVVSSS